MRMLQFSHSFYSSQVKQNLMSSPSNFLCQLPQELADDLRLRILGNKEILAIFQSYMGKLPSVQSLLQE